MNAPAILQNPPNSVTRSDEAAFERLARRLLPRLRRWALVRAGDPDEADEIVQETLIRMHRGLAGFRGGARVSSWAYRILANTANERHRKRNRQPLVRDGSGLETEAPSKEADPAEALHARRMAAVVREYFGTLPAGQREVLELVDHQGMRPVEVAEALEMNPVTVRAHLFKARKAIRGKILERYPELMEGYGR